MLKHNISVNHNFGRECVLREMIKWNTEARNEVSFCVPIWNGTVVYLVKIPKSQDQNRVRKNMKEKQRMSEVPCSLAGRGKLISKEEEEQLTLLLLPIKMDNCDVFVSVTDELGIKSIPTLDQATSFAIQSSCNISFRQMRELC